MSDLMARLNVPTLFHKAYTVGRVNRIKDLFFTRNFMNFLHYSVNLQTQDMVEVTLDKQANVRLLDDYNFGQYKRGAQHKYYGGHTKTSPVRLKAPSAGHWNVVIDLGGYSGTVKASVNIIKG
ncbi:DUF1883 domain-containing protein [Enterobacter sp. JBIWA008]|uniref:DUF1883 domain-containing protein n=1 Tax=Enterobacter sp. JBIWA008 TaxID=2831892 RepID=UPI001CBCC436|nr:DUF1883 domain-containing protein [Enterobacter sp. JBIWA008]UAN42658.1 DUF1883 domain-containing protein [Enterobacter sp. JBIWA008]